MIISLVMAAIMLLTPAKTMSAALMYAEPISQQSSARGVDPLLTTAIIHVETGGQWNANMVSKTNDYGLMQLHVSSTTNPEYVGREELLFVPETNITVGTKMLAYWKKYHKRCKTQHHWWSHYKWGREVKNDLYGTKVASVYARVKRVKAIAMEDHDHSNRRAGRFWEGDTGKGSGPRATAINCHLFSEVRWAVWRDNKGTLARETYFVRPVRARSPISVKV